MGNSNTSKYNRQGKQNNSVQKGSEKTLQRGKLSICRKSVKSSNFIYFILFQTPEPQNSKMIKWRKGQFQIIDWSDDQQASIQIVQQLGEFSESEVIDAIQWSSTGAFASGRKALSGEWCESVCWKLGKKVKLG